MQPSPAHRHRPSRRLTSLVTGVMLLVGGCGFRPMYGTPPPQSAPVAGELASIRIPPIPDRSGQLLRNQLERLLDPASTDTAARYTLSVSLKETVDTFAVERSGFASRASVEMTAHYTLSDDATGAPVLSGTSRAVSAFNLLDNDFSTLVASGDARSRAVDQIAYEIRNRLAGHFVNAAPASASPSS
jgi:LPS-assembly lipoprotein